VTDAKDSRIEWERDRALRDYEAAMGRVAELESERDSLRLERDAALHNRQKDNEYLLAERDRLREVILRATAFVEETRAALAGEEKP
jgi:hypothetical protein